MDIAIMGGHGQIARLMTRRLVGDGHRVRAVIRSEEHVTDVEDDGAVATMHDVEQDDVAHLAEAIDGCDAIVFAAGAGAGSGNRRKWTVDFGGAVQTIRAALASDVARYAMISAMGTDDPPPDDDAFSVYLRAKMAADAELRASPLHWTIVRPGRLTDDDGTGEVRLARHVERGEIPRADVAAVVAGCLATPTTIGHVLEVVGGSTSIDRALAAATD